MAIRESSALCRAAAVYLLADRGPGIFLNLFWVIAVLSTRGNEIISEVDFWISGRGDLIIILRDCVESDKQKC